MAFFAPSSLNARRSHNKMGERDPLCYNNTQPASARKKAQLFWVGVWNGLLHLMVIMAQWPLFSNLAPLWLSSTEFWPRPWPRGELQFHGNEAWIMTSSLVMNIGGLQMMMMIERKFHTLIGKGFWCEMTSRATRISVCAHGGWKPLKNISPLLFLK